MKLERIALMIIESYFHERLVEIIRWIKFNVMIIVLLQ